MENITGSYLQTWVLSLQAREQGDDATEDSLLEQLDQIWLQMTPPQIAMINFLSQKLVEQRITLDHLKALVEWQPQLKSQSTLSTASQKNFGSPYHLAFNPVTTKPQGMPRSLFLRSHTKLGRAKVLQFSNAKSL
jgi:hypothetical protein